MVQHSSTWYFIYWMQLIKYVDQHTKTYVNNVQIQDEFVISSGDKAHTHQSSTALHLYWTIILEIFIKWHLNSLLVANACSHRIFGVFHGCCCWFFFVACFVWVLVNEHTAHSFAKLPYYISAMPWPWMYGSTFANEKHERLRYIDTLQRPTNVRQFLSLDKNCTHSKKLASTIYVDILMYLSSVLCLVQNYGRLFKKNELPYRN